MKSGWCWLSARRDWLLHSNHRLAHWYNAVVSLRGTSHASRYGATILENAGLPELVAGSDTEYINKAVRIARSLPILREFHAKLRRAVQKSRLMDGAAH